MGDNKKGYEFGKLKTPPTEITKEQIDEAIEQSSVYRHNLKWLREQVAYGLRKYPEPLNHKTWDIKETIRHAHSEVADLQNYLSMLDIKLDYSYTIEEVTDMIYKISVSEDPHSVAVTLLNHLNMRQSELKRLFEDTID